ncbi:MAG: hypothetical protein AABW89_01695 [Nanoarchaeota archaeon]
MRFFRKGLAIVSIALAVIAVVGLIFFGVKLSSIFLSNEMKNARSFVDSLSGKIENLEDGENNTFALRGINEWVLVAWNKDTPIARDNEVIDVFKKPQKCLDKNCLCVCKESPSKCQEVGYCREIDRNVAVITNTSIFASSNYNVKDFLGNELRNCYLMDDKLIPFTVNKEEKIVSIIVYEKNTTLGKPIPECPYSYEGVLKMLIEQKRLPDIKK